MEICRICWQNLRELFPEISEIHCFQFTPCHEGSGDLLLRVGALGGQALVQLPPGRRRGGSALVERFDIELFSDS